MKNGIKVGRRDFLKTTGGVLTASALGFDPLLLSANSSSAGAPYSCKFYPFTGTPDADSAWAVSTGPDGLIYAGACNEGAPGGVVKLYRYNEQTDVLDRLFDLGEKTNDPSDSGRATPCKIHYSFAPSLSDGIMYMATHLSASPIDLPTYSPWYSWHDPKRCFKGAALVAYDTKKNEIAWWDTMIPKEGSRCLAIDEEMGLLYSISYPRDHLIIYDIKKRTRRDVGRIGSVNGQCLFIDKKHRVYTTSDYGHLVRYTHEKDRIEISPYVLPFDNRQQTGWHEVFYDVVASPDRECVYASMWMPQPRLLRIWPHKGEWPEVEDLGKLTQEQDLTMPQNMFVDHCGGLTFGADGKLYFVASRWRDEKYNPYDASREAREGVVWRLDPETLKKEEVALLKHQVGTAQYVSRGAIDHNGDLFFGYINHMKKPAGIFKVTMPDDRKKKNAHLPIRIWG
jgi:hypothetical protein